MKENEKLLLSEIEIKFGSSEDLGLNCLVIRNEPNKFKQLIKDSAIQNPNISSDLYNECESSDNILKDDYHSILFNTDLTLKFYFYIIILIYFIICSIKGEDADPKLHFQHC